MRLDEIIDSSAPDAGAAISLPTSGVGNHPVATDEPEINQAQGGGALVFEVAPVSAFGFGKGTYSQTRWRFGEGS